GVADFWQEVVQGSALLIALAADQITAQRRARRRVATELAETAAPTPELAVEPARAGPPPGEVVVEARGLTQSYGSVTAARDVGFAVRSGEILCLVGDNGAGKSTVIKMLSGALQPDEGEILVRGRAVELSQPADAHALGIETAYQELALCPNLGVAENL